MSPVDSLLPPSAAPALPPAIGRTLQKLEQPVIRSSPNSLSTSKSPRSPARLASPRVAALPLIGWPTFSDWQDACRGASPEPQVPRIGRWRQMRGLNHSGSRSKPLNQFRPHHHIRFANTTFPAHDCDALAGDKDQVVWENAVLFRNASEGSRGSKTLASRIRKASADDWSRSLPVQRQLAMGQHAAQSSTRGQTRSRGSSKESKESASKRSGDRPPNPCEAEDGVAAPSKAASITQSAAARQQRRKLQTTYFELRYWTDHFKRVREDNRVHRDDLEQVLQKGGVARPDRELIQEAYDKVSKYTALSEDSFLKFVEVYLDLQRRSYVDAFHGSDTSGNGFVDETTLLGLLKKSGIRPPKHVVREVLSEIDAENRGVFDLVAFEATLEAFRAREGFAKAELQELNRVFDLHRAADVGEAVLLVFAGSFEAMLRWLGWPLELLNSIDVRNGDVLERREFLGLMRRLRDTEMSRLVEAAGGNRLAEGGTVSLFEVAGLFEAIGVLVGVDALQDAAAFLGLEVLDMDDLALLLKELRLREGFSKEDGAEIDIACGKYVCTDMESLGKSLSDVELSGVLRELGYAISFDAVRQLVHHIYPKEPGPMTAREVRKLLRIRWDQEVRIILSYIAEQEDSSRGTIPTETAVSLLNSVELDLELSDVRSVLLDNPEAVLRDDLNGGLNLSDIVRTTRILRSRARERNKRMLGFCDEELRLLRASFVRFDADGRGMLSRAELTALIESEHLRVFVDKEGRLAIQEVLKSLDDDAVDALSFDDYLHAMARLRDVRDRFSARKEDLVTKETRFSREEVAELRDRFLSADVSGDGVLSLQEAGDLMQIMCPMGAKNAQKFAELYASICFSHPSQPGNGSMDFAEFLELMRQLIDINFGDINNRNLFS